MDVGCIKDGLQYHHQPPVLVNTTPGHSFISRVIPSSWLHGTSLGARVNPGKKPQELRVLAPILRFPELGGTNTGAILEATEQTSEDALQQQTSIEGTVPA